MSSLSQPGTDSLSGYVSPNSEHLDSPTLPTNLQLAKDVAVAAGVLVFSILVLAAVGL